MSGVKDLVVLKSTGSEFAGFLSDEFTTLAETHDRVMATSLAVRWRYAGASGVDWQASYDAIRQTLLEQYAVVHSLALQQTLFAMGQTVLEQQPGGRRDPAVGAEHPPLRLRPGALRPGERR